MPREIRADAVGKSQRTWGAGTTVPPITRADCEELDRADPLRTFRDRFHLPSGLIYLDGNSLGAMPKSVPARIARLLEQEWGDDLIRGWTKDGWMELPHAVGTKIGSLIGAGEDETVVADSTSVNLFKVLGAALRLRPDRRVILSERTNFPTDLYIAQGLASMMGSGYALRTVERSEIEAALGPDIAVVMLTHADYRTGRLWDMRRITTLAHQVGALTAWDFSHSVGVVPLDFDGDEADFAVGCGYKYLCGGPGAPAFLTIARRHLRRVAMPLTGWLGHAEPFAFESSFRAAEGIARARVGTPPILSLVALEVGVDLVREATVPALRAKSIRQTELFAALAAQELDGFGFALASPAAADERGSQVSLRHERGWPITQALTAANVIGDFRAPDIVRFGFAPLYVRCVDVWDAVATLKRIMQERQWDQPQFRAAPIGVT
jgi:kynureninase